MISTVPKTNDTPWPMASESTASPAHAERFLRGLEAHQAAEAEDIAVCQALRQQIPDAGFSLLLELIVEDAQRHQALLQTMIERAEDAEIGQAFKPRLDASTITSLRALIRDQHEGARYLRHLGHQEPALHEGLFAILLETMARDSEKHVAMLRYLLRRLDEHGV